MTVIVSPDNLEQFSELVKEYIDQRVEEDSAPMEHTHPEYANIFMTAAEYLIADINGYPVGTAIDIEEE